MLAYIKGTLEMKMTGYIVIEVGGLGYKVFMSESGIDKLGNIGDNVKVHTYYKVREDDISIFGFNSLEELRMFELLISVSGIGAKTAIAMLDVCEPTEFALAIISEDVKTLYPSPPTSITMYPVIFISSVPFIYANIFFSFRSFHSSSNSNVYRIYFINSA